MALSLLRGGTPCELDFHKAQSAQDCRTWIGEWGKPVNWSSVLRGQGRHVCRRVASCPLRNPGSSQARPYPTSRAPLPDLQFQHKGNPRPQEVHHQKGGLGAGRGGCRLFLSTPALPGAPGSCDETRSSCISTGVPRIQTRRPLFALVVVVVVGGAQSSQPPAMPESPRRE